jgi:integrase
MDTTEFMLQLTRSLIKERKIAESSAKAYIKVLYVLNDKKPFKNLTFLKAVDAIDEKIKTYAESTQRAILASLSSVLSLYKDKATFKKPYTHYYDAMMARNKVADEAPKNIMTETQKTNWLTWEAVEKKRGELLEAVGKFGDAKTLKSGEYDTLLNALLLSLYTEIQPRRNQDYLDMYIVKRHTDKMATDKNYLDMATKKFIFNKYKTSKKYGVQTEEIPDKLWEQIKTYLNYHPLYKGKARTSVAPLKFLVTYHGEAIVAVNAITRILNRIFGKRVGATMLRHIYLSDKYGDTLTEMKKDAEGMGHSVATQRNYIVQQSPMLVIQNEPQPPAPLV